MSDVIYEFGPYVLEPAQWRLRHGDRILALPPKALALLVVLVEKQGGLVTKSEALAKVWGGTFVEEGNVAFYVAMLRKRLAEPAGTTYIETVKTRGYRFAVPILLRPRESPVAAEAPAVAGERAGDLAPSVAVRSRHFGLGAFAATALLVLTVAAAVLAARFRSEGPEHALVERHAAGSQASDLVLQARERWRRRTPESINQAIGLYEKAIALDPQSSAAYAGLTDCYNIAMSGLPPDFRYRQAKENVEKAISLDPESAEAHTSLAFMRYKFEWQWRDADDEFRRAITLNPRYQLAHHWYGEFLGLMDRTDEAIAELNTALQLDPSSLAVRADLARPLLRAKRLADARRVLEDGLRIDPTWYGFPLSMSEVLAAEGRNRESAEQTWRAMTQRGVPSTEIEELRAAFAAGAMTGMIRAQIRQMLRQDAAHQSPGLFAAQYLSFAYARLGQRDEALKWLGISVARHEDAPLHMLTNPAYDSIRTDSRFIQLLERLNLRQGLNR